MLRFFRSIIVFFKTQWGVLWRFFMVIAIVGLFLRKVELPKLECQLNVSSPASLSFVDISGQKKEVEKLSSKPLFFGFSDEEVPQDLKLKEWDEMEFIEPIFAF